MPSRHNYSFYKVNLRTTEALNDKFSINSNSKAVSRDLTKSVQINHSPQNQEKFCLYEKTKYFYTLFIKILCNKLFTPTFIELKNLDILCYVTISSRRNVLNCHQNDINILKTQAEFSK